MASASEWADRVKAVSSLNGDELSRALALFQVDWKREYREAFARIAKERGWVHDMIGDLCQQSVATAYAASDTTDPTRAAECMVEAMETQP